MTIQKRIDEKEGKLKEIQMFVLAGINMTRPPNSFDIRYAVERGFEEGYALALEDVKKIIETEVALKGNPHCATIVLSALEKLEGKKAK